MVNMVCLSTHVLSKAGCHKLTTIQTDTHTHAHSDTDTNERSAGQHDWLLQDVLKEAVWPKCIERAKVMVKKILAQSSQKECVGGDPRVIEVPDGIHVHVMEIRRWLQMMKMAMIDGQKA